MIQRIRPAVSGLLALAALSACSLVDPPPQAEAAATILGEVRTESGAPVVGAAVLVEVYHPGCEGGAITSTHGKTGTTGGYRARATVPTDGERCLVATALAPAGTGLRSTTVSGVPANFVWTRDGTPASEVRIDFILPAE